jgi:hypothetical protein
MPPLRLQIPSGLLKHQLLCPRALYRQTPSERCLQASNRIRDRIHHSRTITTIPMCTTITIFLVQRTGFLSLCTHNSSNTSLKQWHNRDNSTTDNHQTRKVSRLVEMRQYWHMMLKRHFLALHRYRH